MNSDFENIPEQLPVNKIGYLIPFEKETVRVFSVDEKIPFDNNIFDYTNYLYIRIQGVSTKKYITVEELPTYMNRIIDCTPFLAFVFFLGVRKQIHHKDMVSQNKNKNPLNIILHQFPQFVPDGIYNAKKRLRTSDYESYILQYELAYYLVCHAVANENPGVFIHAKYSSKHFYNLSNREKHPHIASFLQKNPDFFDRYNIRNQLEIFHLDHQSSLLHAILAPTFALMRNVRSFFQRKKAKTSDLNTFFTKVPNQGGKVGTRKVKRKMYRTTKTRKI
jgi:hypothetical protein